LHDFFISAVTAAGPDGVAALGSSRTCTNSQATESLTRDINDIDMAVPNVAAGGRRVPPAKKEAGRAMRSCGRSWSLWSVKCVAEDLKVARGHCGTSHAYCAAM
jgi:hypothetical protein